MTNDLLSRLNREWFDLAHHPLPDRWREEPALRTAVVVGDLLVCIRQEPDAALAALLRQGQSDALARRVMLQTMLGRMVNDAVRDPDHGLDEYVGELWLTIAGYPLQRRPRRIAANLALDTRKRVRARQPQWAELPEGVAQPEVPCGEVDELLAEARRQRLINDNSERALRLVYQEGLRSDQAAALLGVSPSAVRWRCRRAVQAMARRAEELADW